MVSVNGSDFNTISELGWLHELGNEKGAVHAERPLKYFCAVFNNRLRF